MEISQIINTFNELSAYILPKSYLPAMYDIAFSRRRAGLSTKIPRSIDGVEGLKVYLTFITKYPWAWRAMSEMGFTPTGNKFDSNEQYAQLSCHAASAIVSLTEIEATQQGRWTGIIGRQMDALSKTFPYYMRALLWTSQNAQKALGKAASVNGLVITLDNVGLWNTETTDRCKLFEPGMIVQVYRSTAKVGAPVEITAVDKKLGTITLASDPGIADNDIFVLADVGGLDVPYTTLFPGILDVIDDDNTFQGMDRSTATNAGFRAVVKSASGLTLDRDLLTDFFFDLYDPDFAYTHRKVFDAYAAQFADQRQFLPGTGFVDDTPFIQVGKTKLLVDDEVDIDKLIVPDNANWRIADRGAVENLFGKGWQQIAKRPFLEYECVWWGLLLAEDCRYMGQMHSISLT